MNFAKQVLDIIFMTSCYKELRDHTVKQGTVHLYGYGSINSKHAHPLPAPPPAFVGHFSVFKNDVANAPRWGQLIRTNPKNGGASGRVQMPDPTRIKSGNTTRGQI